MIMLAVMTAFLALAIALAAMWLAGGASRKAEAQHLTFYESHIKGVKTALSDVSKTVGKMGGEVATLKQLSGAGGEDNALEERISKLEKKVDQVSEAVAKLGAALTAAK